MIFLLRSAPVLKAQDFSKEFKLAVDASDFGAGAILIQCDEDSIDHQICYYSKKLIITK